MLLKVLLLLLVLLDVLVLLVEVLSFVLIFGVFQSIAPALVQEVLLSLELGFEFLVFLVLDFGKLLSGEVELSNFSFSEFVLSELSLGEFASLLFADALVLEAGPKNRHVSL